MTTETRTSEYHYKDWWPNIQPVDFIPIVGMITLVERKRRKDGLPFADYLPWRSSYFKGRKISTGEVVSEVLSPGTRNWPEPTSRAAALRANLMGARNASLCGYHALIMIALIRAVA